MKKWAFVQDDMEGLCQQKPKLRISQPTKEWQ